MPRLPMTEQLHLNLAATLNSGQPVRWPKGANAIKVLLPGGKTATVLKGDEDTFKGVGIDDKAVIRFGRVPFNRQQRPDRSRFIALQSAAPSMLGDARPDTEIYPAAGAQTALGSTAPVTNCGAANYATAAAQPGGPISRQELLDANGLSNPD